MYITLDRRVVLQPVTKIERVIWQEFPESLAEVFSYNFCEIFKNTIFCRTPR